MIAFWDVAPGSLLEVDRRFRVICVFILWHLEAAGGGDDTFLKFEKFNLGGGVK
jgi:hypothetical protein